MFYSGGLYHQGITQPEVWIGPDGNPYDWNQILDGDITEVIEQLKIAEQQEMLTAATT